MKIRNYALSEKHLSTIDYLIIIAFSIVPLFATFPYRVNIFLSYEGAYRLYMGEIPYKDFGLPMGFGYWLIPAAFFKIFGPYLVSLIKAQVFINTVSGLSFRSILGSLNVDPLTKTTGVLLFCISYSFFNFWPWYNHSVIVFELIALSFLLRSIFMDRHSMLYLIACAFFVFLSFFTKQDGGGLSLLVCLTILLYESIYEHSVKKLLIFLGAFMVIGIIVVFPFLKYDFFYWFNYGQPPHNSRINLYDFIATLMGGSFWEKFYLSVIAIIILINWQEIKLAFSQNKKQFIFLLLTISILGEAIIFQVTSYTPPDNNIFFHSFAIVFILSTILDKRSKLINPLLVISSLFILMLFWWSNVYWKYVERSLARINSGLVTNKDSNKISKNTYTIRKDTTNISMAEWKFSKLKSFKKVYMPGSTVEGMDRLMQMPEIKNNPNPRVLNMTELTPLVNEIHYEFEKGQPLWFHKGVGMFDKEIEIFIGKIRDKQYDLVLFEVIPYLNNFYPEEVREALQTEYILRDKFLAPRRPTDSYIEVYTRN